MRRRLARHKPCSPGARLLGVTVLVLACGGSLQDARAAEAGDSHPVDTVLKMLNLKADPGRPPDFVEQSRRGANEYIPTGIRHPDRPIKPKSPTDIKAAEAELDAARLRQTRAAGLPPDPPAALAKPIKPGKPKQLGPAAATQN